VQPTNFIVPNHKKRVKSGGKSARSQPPIHTQPSYQRRIIVTPEKKIMTPTRKNMKICTLMNDKGQEKYAHVKEQGNEKRTRYESQVREMHQRKCASP
jgi:hypothetical protein